MDIAAFLLARLRDEEEEWTRRAQDPDQRRSAEGRLVDCAGRRQQINAYTAQPSRARLQELQRLALAYYHHPDYKEVWLPLGVEGR